VKNETDAHALEVQKAAAAKNGKGTEKTVEGECPFCSTVMTRIRFIVD
jgi:hypothetical protein